MSDEPPHRTPLYRVIHGALKDHLNTHGDITKTNLSSATKRIMGAVKGLETREGSRYSITKWLEEGVEMGYCSSPVCDTHDGLPSTPEEDAEWDEGHDPCVPAVRLLPND